MRIVMICEGLSEEALKRSLRRYIAAQCEAAGRPLIGLEFKRFNGAPNCGQLMRYVEHFGKRPEVIGIVGLIDVYPEFESAEQAKTFLARCVQRSSYRSKFHAHAAQMELEAWLLPFWRAISARLGVSCQPPGMNPEQVDGQKPPSAHFKELYQRAKRRYNKADVASKLFENCDLETAAKQCFELRALLLSIAELCRPQMPAE